MKGVLFTTKSSTDSDLPNMVGKIEAPSGDIEIKGWVKNSKKGEKYLRFIATSHEAKTLSGVLFRNKEKQDKQPDYTGVLRDAATHSESEVKVKAWKMISKKSQIPYLSLIIES